MLEVSAAGIFKRETNVQGELVLRYRTDPTARTDLVIDEDDRRVVWGKAEHRVPFRIGSDDAADDTPRPGERRSHVENIRL
jgi:hypothetical protein